MIQFEIKPPPKSLNLMLRMHHHTQTRIKAQIRKEVWAQMVCWGRGTRRSWPLQKATIHATRYAMKRLDGFDNYRGSLKWVVDALTTKHNGLGIIQDDTDECLEAGRITQVHVGHINQERLVVVIEPQPKGDEE